MINFEQAYIEELALHKIHVGDESSVYSESVVEVNSELSPWILKYLLGSVNTPEFHAIDRETEDSPFELIHSVFNEEDAFLALSQKITKRLERVSDDSRILPGECILAKINDLLIDDELVQALVICKVESKDQFLKVIKAQNEFTLEHVEGLLIGKVDKIAIILNTETETGFKVLIKDTTSAFSEAMFWKSDFLKLRQRQGDTYAQTKAYINTTKSFIKDRLEKVYDIDKTDEAAILNRSKDFFEHIHDFDSDTYAEKVFMDDNVTELFESYKKDQETEKNIQFDDQFQVSQAAVKNYSRVFKSVIKLDKNFHIYVHGDRNLIEKGTDEMGRKFYRIFYEDER